MRSDTGDSKQRERERTTPHSGSLAVRTRVPSRSVLTLCGPVDCSPPGSCLHGTLQARTLERVAMPSSRGSSCQRLNLRLFRLHTGRRAPRYYCRLGSPGVWQRHSEISQPGVRLFSIMRRNGVPFLSNFSSG